MALKLDMSKAYDRVEWVFLEKIMKHLGFADVFVILIMSCLSSVSYSVSSNTQKDVQVRIQHFLGVPAIRQYEKYLGLLALAGQAKKQSFIYLKERVWRKLQGWKEKHLS